MVLDPVKQGKDRVGTGKEVHKYIPKKLSLRKVKKKIVQKVFAYIL